MFLDMPFFAKMQFFVNRPTIFDKNQLTVDNNCQCGPLPGPVGVRRDLYRQNIFGGGGPLPGA